MVRGPEALQRRLGRAWVAHLHLAVDPVMDLLHGHRRGVHLLLPRFASFVVERWPLLVLWLHKDIGIGNTV